MKKYNKTKNGLYKAYIVVGKNENGKDKRKYVYSKSAKELDKKLAEIKVLYHKGIVLDDNNMTVQDLGELWFNSTQAKNQHNTKENIKRILKLHIYPTLGYIPVKNLKAYQVQELLNTKMQEGLKTTVTKMMNYINAMLNLAVENDFIYKNVASNIKIPYFKAKEKLPLNKFERSVIESVAKTHKHGDMILTFLYSGLRREELIPLKKEDLNFETSKILINKAITFVSNQPIIKSTKNCDNREIPILDRIEDILKRRCENAKNDYLFPMRNGNMMSKTSFREAMENFEKSCNKYIDSLNKEIKKEHEKHNHIHFTAHVFRHTFCTFLYYSNIKLKRAQEIMGHRSSKITLEIYTHLDEEQEENPKNAIDNYLKNVV